MLRPFLAVSAFCLLAATPAAHADLSYSYVEGSVLKNNIDTAVGEDDGTGLEGRFSYDILRFLHVYAGTRLTELDDLPLETTLVEAGAGVHYALHEHASVFFDLGAFTADSDVSGSTISADDEGYTYAIGYREENRTGRMEFNLSAEHIEFNDADTGDTWINLGLIFRATPRFKITTAVQFAGDENAFNVGIRYYLPSRFAEP